MWTCVKPGKLRILFYCFISDGAHTIKPISALWCHITTHMISLNLVIIGACHLFSARPLAIWIILTYHQVDLYKEIWVFLIKISLQKHFTKKNYFRNDICKVLANSPSGQWVNTSRVIIPHKIDGVALRSGSIVSSWRGIPVTSLWELDKTHWVLSLWGDKLKNNKDRPTSYKHI